MNYAKVQTFSDNGTILSDVYLSDDERTYYIIDKNTIFNTEFSYRKYCQHQNELMGKGVKVFRYLQDDSKNEIIYAHESQENGGYIYGNYGIDRENVIVDPSPLEYLMEQYFIDSFGYEAVKYLAREYSLMLPNGKVVYIDYALFHQEGYWIAIEENGISYHHPYLIGEEKYRRVLNKQNAVVSQNGQVFRWDTESMGQREKTIDELKDFIGDIRFYIPQQSTTSSRGFKFYDHQADYLTELSRDRIAGRSSALIVLPTGTGKTRIALQDIENLAEHNEQINALVLSPTKDLKSQWEEVAQKFESESIHLESTTYAEVSRRYYRDPPDKYDYIVVDEAHHGVSPVLKKVIHHYQPRFLLGLTATDKRLDGRKIESVFGQYEEKLDLREAIEKGLLCQIRCMRLESNIDLSQVRFKGKDYFFSDLERTIRIDSRNSLIADILSEYFCDKLPDKNGLVYCVSVAHAREMSKILKGRGINAESVDGTDPRRREKVDAYQRGEIQFLCTCSLLNEGWDSPHTSVIVMARPTLSRVLYLQQLGRGTRNHPGKEALYVIDVVDNYGSFGSIQNRPWSLHGLFNLEQYKKFADLFPGRRTDNRELQVLDTLHENIVKLQPVDLFTMEKQYGDYLSAEQLARELFVSTGTVNSWRQKGDITADVEIPIGRSKILLFHPDRVDAIRKLKGLREHTEETIVEDFWEFIDEKTYTFSYKMFFIKALLETVDQTGEADIKQLLRRYRKYYLDRIERGLDVDRSNSPYNNKEILQDEKIMLQSMLTNPFEKFERKRFMYYAKDLARISIHHKIWSDLEYSGGRERLLRRMDEDLIEYYEPLGGL
jgi:superfamily II DNA or RNA helicase